MEWLGNEALRRSSVQLALDGRWEEAISVAEMDSDSLRDWLVGAGVNIAIESVYCDDAGNLRGFFGFRQNIENAHQRLAFWRDVVAASSNYEFRAPGEQLAAWLALLGEPPLLSTEAAGTKLGVFNQWLTAGSVPLDRVRLDESDVSSGPAWLRDGATAPICRELYWLAPERIWLAETACDRVDGLYRLDRSLLPA